MKLCTSTLLMVLVSCSTQTLKPEWKSYLAEVDGCLTRKNSSYATLTGKIGLQVDRTGKILRIGGESSDKEASGVFEECTKIVTCTPERYQGGLKKLSVG